MKFSRALIIAVFALALLGGAVLATCGPMCSLYWKGQTATGGHCVLWGKNYASANDLPTDFAFTIGDYSGANNDCTSCRPNNLKLEWWDQNDKWKGINDLSYAGSQGEFSTYNGIINLRDLGGNNAKFNWVAGYKYKVTVSFDGKKYACGPFTVGKGGGGGGSDCFADINWFVSDGMTEGDQYNTFYFRYKATTSKSPHNWYLCADSSKENAKNWKCSITAEGTGNSNEATEISGKDTRKNLNEDFWVALKVCDCDNKCDVELAAFKTAKRMQCSDGTYYGQCSSSKSLYCDNGKLVERCDLCGCPPDKSYCDKKDNKCYSKSSCGTQGADCGAGLPNCCSGLDCINGKCAYKSACGDFNAKCGAGLPDCCSGLTCADGLCKYTASITVKIDEFSVNPIDAESATANFKATTSDGKTYDAYLDYSNEDTKQNIHAELGSRNSAEEYKNIPINIYYDGKYTFTFTAVHGNTATATDSHNFFHDFQIKFKSASPTSITVDWTAKAPLDITKGVCSAKGTPVKPANADVMQGSELESISFASTSGTYTVNNLRPNTYYDCYLLGKSARQSNKEYKSNTIRAKTTEDNRPGYHVYVREVKITTYPNQEYADVSFTVTGSNEGYNTATGLNTADFASSSQTDVTETNVHWDTKGHSGDKSASCYKNSCVARIDVRTNKLYDYDIKGCKDKTENGKTNRYCGYANGEFNTFVPFVPFQFSNVKATTTADTATISWTQTMKKDNNYVQYSRVDNVYYYRVEAECKRDLSLYDSGLVRCVAVITGLTPSTKYIYNLNAGNNGDYPYYWGPGWFTTQDKWQEFCSPCGSTQVPRECAGQTTYQKSCSGSGFKHICEQQGNSYNPLVLGLGTTCESGYGIKCVRREITDCIMSVVRTDDWVGGTCASWSQGDWTEVGRIPCEANGQQTCCTKGSRYDAVEGMAYYGRDSKGNSYVVILPKLIPAFGAATVSGIEEIDFASAAQPMVNKPLSSGLVSKQPSSEEVGTLDKVAVKMVSDGDLAPIGGMAKCAVSSVGETVSVKTEAGEFTVPVVACSNGIQLGQPKLVRLVGKLSLTYGMPMVEVAVPGSKDSWPGCGRYVLNLERPESEGSAPYSEVSSGESLISTSGISTISFASLVSGATVQGNEAGEGIYSGVEWVGPINWGDSRDVAKFIGADIEVYGYVSGHLLEGWGRCGPIHLFDLTSYKLLSNKKEMTFEGAIDKVSYFAPDGATHEAVAMFAPESVFILKSSGGADLSSLVGKRYSVTGMVGDAFPAEHKRISGTFDAFELGVSKQSEVKEMTVYGRLSMLAGPSNCGNPDGDCPWVMRQAIESNFEAFFLEDWYPGFPKVEESAENRDAPELNLVVVPTSAYDEGAAGGRRIFSAPLQVVSSEELRSGIYSPVRSALTSGEQPHYFKMVRAKGIPKAYETVFPRWPYWPGEWFEVTKWLPDDEGDDLSFNFAPGWNPVSLPKCIDPSKVEEIFAPDESGNSYCTAVLSYANEPAAGAETGWYQPDDMGPIRVFFVYCKDYVTVTFRIDQSDPDCWRSFFYGIGN